MELFELFVIILLGITILIFIFGLALFIGLIKEFDEE
jgi:hypothetical protein